MFLNYFQTKKIMTGPLLPRKSDVENDTDSNHNGGKTEDDRRDNHQVHCQGDTPNRGRYELCRYQKGDPIIVWRYVVTLPTTLGRGIDGHVGLIIKETIYGTLFQTAWVTRSWSRTDCDDGSQRGTKVTTTGQSRRETTYL